MGDLVGLPGVKGRIENVKYADSVSGAMKAFKTERAVTGAGDFGAWTIWKDDEGRYRCDFSRYCATVNTEMFGTKVGVREWLKKWLPQVHKRPA